MINHCAWHQRPVFVGVCRPLTCLQCRGSLLRAPWLWPSAWRCYRSGAPQSSAPPASPTSPTSEPQAACTRSVQSQQLLSMGSCLLLPVVSRTAHHQNFLSAALNSCSPSQMFRHRPCWHKVLQAGPGVLAVVSSWLYGFETRPGNKRGGAKNK